MVLSTITGALLFFFAIFQCSPISFYWDKEGVQGICRRDTEVKIMYFYSVIDVIFDIAIGILPAIFIRKLKLDRRTKLGIAGLLGLGCIACAAVIARIPFLHLMTEESFLYETTMVAVCSDVETGLGIMAGCFMVMRRGFSFFNKSNEKDIPKGYVTPQFVSQTSDSTLRVEYA
ncbi:hypothetical protein BDV30DRAFT_231018 [Aspergillus minisclerotigenes]|uniref:Rhodopsin domain-containing protein n=1 Tax=Aspergillus minisclerotigenes TaxID=656917 RepID=A0A5N6IQ92_9EURO|nr:hypothetical protein BDV30DRAFT_231018 [Aspergillus minisclerotigenes]